MLSSIIIVLRNFLTALFEHRLNAYFFLSFFALTFSLIRRHFSLSQFVSFTKKLLVRRPGCRMTKFSKFRTLLKKLSVGETKVEKICTKISRSVKDAPFDQSDAKSLQERLALAFADFANSQYGVMTLHDVDWTWRKNGLAMENVKTFAMPANKFYSATVKFNKQMTTLDFSFLRLLALQKSPPNYRNSICVVFVNAT